MRIVLKVNKHPSGRFTLTERTQMEMQPKDCREEFLFGNPDAGTFYRAVANKLHKLHCEGYFVVYDDA